MYLVLGSASGTAPGFPLGTVTLPLVFDGYTSFTIANSNTALLNQTFGVLDPTGAAQASFALPAGTSPALAGAVLNHAFLDLDGFAVDFVSNAVAVTLTP